MIMKCLGHSMFLREALSENMTKLRLMHFQIEDFHIFACFGDEIPPVLMGQSSCAVAFWGWSALGLQP